MTSMNRDTDYSNLAQAIRFAIRQSLKDMYTCMPGIVESYDAETRRAVVKGALKVVTTNKEEIEREAIHNVPVLFPSGGRSAFTFPLEPGDPVLLVYSQRGLANWKKTLDVTTPDMFGFLSEKDAIAIPGFVGHHEPENQIAVEAGGVRIKTTGKLAIEAQDVTFKRAGSSAAPESIITHIHPEYESHTHPE